MVTKALSPQKLDRYQNQDRILWSTGRFNSSGKFKCEDVQMILPFYHDPAIAPADLTSLWSRDHQESGARLWNLWNHATSTYSTWPQTSGRSLIHN